jgi:hypothetical protein
LSAAQELRGLPVVLHRMRQLPSTRLRGQGERSRRTTNKMQTIYHHQSKPAAKPHGASDAQRTTEAPRKRHQKTQTSGLSREELRQIVIDMIG